MTAQNFNVLIADADPGVRAILSAQLASVAVNVFEAADGGSALRTLEANDIRLVLCELYLRTGTDDDLISAIRRDKALERTRVIAHTRFGKSADSDWARRVGADGYLIRPVSNDRLRAVVTAIVEAIPSRQPPTNGARDAETKTGGRRAGSGTPKYFANGAPDYRDSLDVALTRIEGGTDGDVTGIVVGRHWWDDLTRAEQTPYRRRAKQARVTLRKAARLSDQRVEVRSSDSGDPSAKRKESAYRD